MVRAILDGRKTQTRRVVKPQPDAMYGLTDTDIVCYHRKYEKRQAQENSGFSKQRLSSWERRTNLFEDTLCRFWEKGIRGLVSASWPQNEEEWIPKCFFVPQQREGDKVCTQASLHSVPRDAKSKNFTGATSRRQSGKQSAKQLSLGHTAGKLAGSEGARTGSGRGETLERQTIRRGKRTFAMGSTEGTLQPSARGAHPQDVTIFHFSNLPFQVGQILWVRETWRELGSAQTADGSIPPPEVAVGNIIYAADHPEEGPWRSPRYMPKWASRLTLEVTNVRVERVQDIRDPDAIAEGVEWTGLADKTGWTVGGPTQAFQILWDSINKKRGFGWDENPWVWVVQFTQIGG